MKKLLVMMVLSIPVLAVLGFSEAAVCMIVVSAIGAKTLHDEKVIEVIIEKED